MSGPEIGLAVLSLLIAAFDHYDACLRPFSRYKHFSREVISYSKRVKIQKAIFRTRCMFLLRHIVNEEASAMFAENNHPGWRNRDTEHELVQLLGSAKDDCIGLIRLLKEELQAMGTESQELVERAESECQVSSYIGKLRSAGTKKVQFSLSGTRLSERLDAVRILNCEFQSLSENLVKIAKQPRVFAKEADNASSKAIEAYQIIGTASQRIYEDLSVSCTKHENHIAHVKLEVEDFCESQSCTIQIRFKLAFANATRCLELRWFTIKTVMIEASKGQRLEMKQAIDGLSDSLKRTLDDVDDGKTGKRKKSVRFESAAKTDTTVPSTIPDLFTLQSRLHKDFCDFMRRCLSQPLQSDVCIARLANSECCQNLVYPCLSSENCPPLEGVTLQALLKRKSGLLNISRASFLERMRLARLLSEALLRYQGTSWVSLGWRSENIVFFTQGLESNRPPDISIPHLNTKVCRFAQDNMSTSSFEQYLLGPRNENLFDLGILMLEIAYATPWEILQDSHKPRQDLGLPRSDFYQARRLAKSGCSGMGSDYDRIVRQLIECDFGCGEDLSQKRLQAAIHRDVVCPLEKIERGLQELQLGAP